MGQPTAVADSDADAKDLNGNSVDGASGPTHVQQAQVTGPPVPLTPPASDSDMDNTAQTKVKEKINSTETHKAEKGKSVATPMLHRQRSFSLYQLRTIQGTSQLCCGINGSENCLACTFPGICLR
jgi:hypothetical protein